MVCSEPFGLDTIQSEGFTPDPGQFCTSGYTALLGGFAMKAAYRRTIETANESARIKF
jgi:hypothetical protein